MYVNAIFLNGAKAIKANRSGFQTACLELANNDMICQLVREQLAAASVAGFGQTNTGLNEGGWRGFAELIGMVSPRSAKLIIPAGTDPAVHKKAVFEYWLKSGYYPSSRKDGKGGHRALTIKEVDGELMVVMGVRAFGRSSHGKELNASVELAMQKFSAKRVAPATTPASTNDQNKLILID